MMVIPDITKSLDTPDTSDLQVMRRALGRMFTQRMLGRYDDFEGDYYTVSFSGMTKLNI
jgi:hypothetical protein